MGRYRTTSVFLIVSTVSCVQQMLQTPQRNTAFARHASRMTDVEMQEGIKCAVRKQPKSKVALDIIIPQELANEVHDAVLKDLSKNTKVAGFRKGKVPAQAIINELGMPAIKKATVEQCIDVGMQQSSAQVQLNTCGEAKLANDATLEDVAKTYTIGEELAFTIEVDVYPTVPITEDKYKSLQVDVEKIPFNQQAYDRALFKLRDQHCDLVEKDTEAQSEDVLMVNMNGFMATPDGEKGEPLPAVAGGEGIEVPLKEGKFMPGLVEGLIGSKKGDLREIRVSFPSRTSAPQLAGKDAVFEVEILKVQQKELMEVNDEFANRVKPGMTLAELEEKLTEGVQTEVEDLQRQNTHRAIEKALVAASDEFDVPESMIEEVTKERFAMMLADMREKGTPDEKVREIVTPENYERYSKISRAMTINSVKTDFAIKEVGRQQGLTVPIAEVDEEVMTIQAQRLQRGEKFKESEVRPKVEAALQKSMVLDWLMNSATINYVDEIEVTPDEILGASPEELAADVMGVPLESVPKAAEGEGEDDAPAGPAAAPDGYEWGQTF